MQGAPVSLFAHQDAMDQLAEDVLRWRKGRREVDGGAVDGGIHCLLLRCVARL